MPLTSLLRSIGIVVVVVLLIIAANLCFYNVSETEQVILTQFGKTVGQPVNEAGMKFKMPFIQTVNRIDKRILEWDGRASEMPTRDKLYIVVDAFGRWRINDPLQFFTRLRDERSALSRLDDIIGSEVRNAIAKHDLIEIVRTDKNRKASADAAPADDAGQINRLLPITLGRTAIEKEIVEKSAPKLKDFGIELIDVRFMRVNYNPGVSAKIHERMMSERQQIASRFRSEGEGELAKGLAKSGQKVAFRWALPVDATGDLPDGRKFRDIREFKQLLLADEKQIARNVARQLTIYATGAPIGFADRAQIEEVLQRASSSHYGVRSLIHELVQSDLFLAK